MNKYLINALVIFFITSIIISFTSCEEEEEPYIAEPVEAIYDFDSTTNINKPKFWSKAEIDDSTKQYPLSYFWGVVKDGSVIESSEDSVFTPTINYTGKYQIVFEVQTKENALSQNDTFVYECTRINPEIINGYLKNLSVESEENELFTKKWVLSNKQGHIKTGSSHGIDNGTGIDYLNDPIDIAVEFPENALLDADSGIYAYNNVMEFGIDNNIYKNAGPSKWITNWYFANREFGYNQAEDTDICIDIAHGLDTTGNFLLEENSDGTVFLTLSGKNFLLYYEGKPSKTRYQVLALYEDLLVVRKPYYDTNGDPTGYRMLYYVPENNRETDISNRNLSVINPPTE